MTEDEHQVIAELGKKFAENRLGPRAVGALEIAVLNEQRYRRIEAAPDVVALRIDGPRVEIEQRLGLRPT